MLDLAMSQSCTWGMVHHNKFISLAPVIPSPNNTVHHSIPLINLPVKSHPCPHPSIQVFQRVWYMMRDTAMSRAQAGQHPTSGLAACLVEEDTDVMTERCRIEDTPIDLLMQTDALILHGTLV